LVRPLSQNKWPEDQREPWNYESTLPKWHLTADRQSAKTYYV